MLGHQSTSPPVIHLTLIHHPGAPLMEQRAPSHGTANNPHMERRAPARRTIKAFSGVGECVLLYNCCLRGEQELAVPYIAKQRLQMVADGCR